MVKIEKYNMVRDYIKINKFEIKEVIGERKIDLCEFDRMKRFIS